MFPCEAGTYSPWNKTLYQYNCMDCDTGYYCPTPGMANITGFDCPKGHYCPQRTVEPRPCPPGTYQESIGAIEEDACEGCPLGKYCPEAAEQPIDCEDGYYCSWGSAAMLTCTGGFYCNEDTRW